MSKNMADNGAQASTPEPPFPYNLPAPNNYAMNLLNPSTAHTRMAKNHILMLAIFATMASTPNKEATWYGPWTIALDLLFMDTHIMPNGICYPIPQMSVSFDYDPGQSDGENDTTDDPFLDKGQTVELVNYGRSMARGLSPSPGRVSSAVPIATPPVTPPVTPPGTPAITPLGTSTGNHRPRRPRRSTRVPDFCQIVQKIGRDSRNLQYQASRLILIVEVKPLGILRIDWVFGEAAEQIISQANHAFRSDRHLQKLGCIIAVGPLWTYFERTRQDMSPSPVGSERHDPSYRETSTETTSSTSNTSNTSSSGAPYPAEFLLDIFEQDTYLCLQDDRGRSNRAFARIYDRLKDRIDAI